MTKNLIYFVQGSQGNTYKVTFTGTGENLSSFCTCPAFSRGGHFCKHVAALLLDDISRLKNGTDDIERLKEATLGSPLLEQALHHTPSQPRERSQISDPDEAWGHLARIGTSKGFSVKKWEAETFDPKQHGITFHKINKHGKPLKSYKAAIYYCALRTELVTTIDEFGEVDEVEHILPRSKCWVVNIEGKSISYGSLERAIPMIEKWLER